MASRSRAKRSPARHGSIICAAIAAGLVLGPVLAAPAFASTGCGDFSFGFEGTRLLNDGISNAAGPFPAEIPAGTYEVTLVSGDQHSEQINIPSQPSEQFVVVLDSGYVSPPSRDVPDDADEVTTSHPNQEIAASTTISVQHVGSEGINSVNVLCVGFSPTAPADSGPAAEEPVAEEPAAGDPAAEDPAAADPNDPAQTPVAQPVVEEPPAEDPPIQEIIEPISIVRDPPAPVEDPAVEVPAAGDVEPEAVVEPEVLAVVEEAPSPAASPDPAAVEEVSAVSGQLAVTGPPRTAIFTLVGLGFLLLGAVLVTRERLLGA